VPRAPQPLVPQELLELSRERDEIRQKALTMASSEPDATAQLLRAWLVKKRQLPNGRGE
jgi:flagellar biosynthesis/type III secretory pathway M-ring protein FliF/YscJ